MCFRSQILHRQAGYTLVEVLISVAILAVVMTMVSMTLSNTVKMTQTAETEHSQERQARICLSFIAEDLMTARIHPRFPWNTKNSEFEGQPADLLAFVSTGRASGLETGRDTGLSRVVYTREGDRLTRLALRNLQGAIPEGIERLDLATGVVSFDLRYYDDTTRKWVDEWDGRVRKSLPRTVMIELTLMNNRHERRTFTEWATITARYL